MVSDEKAKALFANWIEQLKEIVEAGSWQIVEARKVSRMEGSDIETFVREVDAFRVVSHAHPKGMWITFYLPDDIPKGVYLASLGTDMDVSDGPEGEDVGSGGVNRLN